MGASTSIWDSVVWLLGFVALWVVASIPGYWFLSVWMQLRDVVRSTLNSLISSVNAGRARRAASASAVQQDLMDRMRVFEIDQTAANAWRQTLGTMLEGVRAGGTQIDTTRTSAIQTTKRLERSALRVRKLKLVSAVVPDVPTVNDALLRARRNRAALVNLILAVLLLVPIVFANAQLTGLVLRELIPPVQPILGVPVAYALALIIVIAEAAIGLLHSAEAEQREESERKLTMAGIVWSVAAVGVVAIETVLYSQVQPDSSALRLPIGGSAFALVGALLGLAVFGLGRLAHSSGVTLRKDRTPKVIAKQLNRLKDAADEWNLVADRLQPLQKTCSDNFERLVGLCRQTSESQGHAIEQFTVEIEMLRESAPAWARPAERRLTQSEFSERESRTYLWLAVTVIATFSLIVLCAQLATRLQVSAGATVGLGLAAAAFAAGALGSQNAPDRRGWRLAWYVVLIVVVGAFTVASERFLRGIVSLHTAVALIPAIAAFTAGIQIGQGVALLRLPLLWLTDRFIDAVLFTCVAVFWSINGLTAIVEYLARLIAWPTLTVVGFARSKRGTNSHATIA